MLTLQCSCTQLIVALSVLLLYAAVAAAAPAALLRPCILVCSYIGGCHRVCSYHDHE